MIKTILNLFKNLILKNNSIQTSTDWLGSAEQNIATLEAKIKEIENKKYEIKPPIEKQNYSTNVISSTTKKTVLKNFRLITNKA